MGGEFTVKQGDTHATPPVGYMKLYAKTNGLWYTKDSDGIEVPVFGGTVTTAVRNETGGLLSKHRLIAVTGYSVAHSRPIVDYADKDDSDLRPAIGILIEDVSDNSNSNALVVGTLSGMDTSAYSLTDQLVLGNSGNLVRPPPDNSPFTGEIQNVGSVSRVDASLGEVVISIDGMNAITGQQVFSLVYNTEMMTGWFDTNQFSLAFTEGTRTLDITAVSGNYKYYENGVPFEDNADSIVIDDTEGLHMVYFDGETLSKIANPTSSQILATIRAHTLVAFLYWDATNDKLLYGGYESHTFRMPKETHIYLHLAEGGRYISGNLATNVLVDQSGNLDTHAQFGLTSGEMKDEDVSTLSSAVASTTGLPIYHLEGSEASPSARQVVNSGFSVRTAGTGRLAYNRLLTGTWSVQEVPNNQFVLCHVFASNDFLAQRKLIAFMGQAAYQNITQARAAAESEINSLVIGRLVSQELVKLYTFIFQTSDGYANAVKGRIRSTDLGDDYIDWRGTTGVGGGGTSVIAEFINLVDTPSSYSGQSGKVVAVNSGENALEFVSATGQSLQWNVHQVAHGFAVKDAVYLTTGGAYAKAKADSANTLGLYLVTAVAGVDDFTLVKAGRVTITSHGWTVGNYYFVSDATAGLLTSTEPSNYSNPLVFVLDANTVDVLSFRPEAIGAAITDLAAIHKDVAAEISTITEKVTPASADLLLIEDSAAGNAKKKLQVGRIRKHTYTVADLTALNAITGEVAGETAWMTTAPSGKGLAWYFNGTTWQVLGQTIQLTNRSGGALVEGDVVVVDAANNDSCTTTTVAYDDNVIGVVVIGGANNTEITIAVSGVWNVYITSAAARGYWVSTTTVAGDSQDVATPSDGSYGQVVQQTGGAGLARCWLFGKEAY